MTINITVTADSVPEGMECVVFIETEETHEGATSSSRNFSRVLAQGDSEEFLITSAQRIIVDERKAQSEEE